MLRSGWWVLSVGGDGGLRIVVGCCHGSADCGCGRWQQRLGSVGAGSCQRDMMLGARKTVIKLLTCWASGTIDAALLILEGTRWACTVEASGKRLSVAIAGIPTTYIAIIQKATSECWAHLLAMHGYVRAELVTSRKM
eukprot:3128793-Pleurochrysis_carterae.AAC.3